MTDIFENYSSPWLNEELLVLRDAARKFFTTELGPHQARWEEQGMVDRDAWTKTGAAGFLLAEMPVEYGGSGGDYRHETVIMEEQLRAGASGLGSQVHSQIVAPYFLHYGTEEQKQKWLPKMATGECVGAIAMTEPNTGSDLQGVRTTAIRDGDDYVINGSKTYISNGQHCDLVIVVAKTDPTQGAKGISLIVVEANTPGFQRGRNLKKMGQAAADTSELFFADCRVPVGNCLGDEGKGFVQLMQQLPQERLNIAQAAVVEMERAIAMTIDFVKQRKAFGQRVMDFQNTKFKLAECKTEAFIARTFVDQCLVRHMAGELDASTASMAKYWCTDKQNQIIDTCLQLHGGAGYMEEYPISGMYKDARVQSIYGGTNEIMKELISRTLDA
ncbi:acyl-CoA dehydrogenase family protein [Pseudomonadales bacterium]|nr:acyl-CoA dehydrogenase family protein [Pseudomonadales bacterium]MDA8953791.1 acyl-CoA dehydrogenase family protein [Pseudomonadales bacterium]MDC1322200.1 acyl-CoA dehydrogenase family protein [Pseudomonadales bacterium]